MSVTGSRFMNLVRLKGLPILRQLHIEEQLLQTSSDNWCIVNDGTNDPDIFMGVSGVPRKLLEIGPVLRDEIPVIRRFTGGGTVVVDSGTVFVTLMCNKDAVAGLQPYSRPIMSWSGNLYARVFQGVGGFNPRENDSLSRVPRELLEIGPVLRDEIPVIRRFTGGGTVVVDGGTVFVTLICNKDAVAGLHPRPIVSWSGHLYARVFPGVGDFNLRENVTCCVPNGPKLPAVLAAGHSMQSLMRNPSQGFNNM
ncbi:hypothetical protein FNV43_RR20916 [Rhamnella rubrinervis]|uniref:BPL/LPL catalytic domain-containing protein n=1 Tax=Rhamnella rubrinervis TaxID=2594499 RepID=A0A8K0GXF3_9ROSA|nr:hypothetical protein FNV43_RR20916 [Rhamnella rubrinervis]